MTRLTPLRFVMVAATILVLAQFSSAKTAYAVKPPPAWVKPTPVSKPAASVTSQASGSLFLLSDHQIRVVKDSTERYSRRVRKVVNASGLDDLSQLQLEFEPTYEELVIHHVRIQRGETTIDALNPREIKVIQQESDLNQRIYNGTLSALILLNDVRVGDIIDYAYSIVGANPVLGGRYADTYSLAAGQYVGKIQWRLLWPSSRSLQYRGLNSNAAPAIQQNGEETEYVWSQDEVAAVEFEDNIPRWFRPVPTIQLSEFANWGDVVKWALPLYTLKQPIDAALKNQIDHWASETDDPAKRLISAVRFVQDEVRYMGIELGPSSHTPTQPSTVFKRRFGDCKDKTFLLATILSSLGIEAIPALVNTNAQHTLDTYQPSPLAFDHVILQVTLNGEKYWIDATATLQRGLPTDLNYRRALVLREGTETLAEIPQENGDEPTTIVREIYTVPTYKSPALLEVTTTYKGNDADEMRAWLAEQTISELAKTWLNYYAQVDSDIQAAGPPKISDETNSNVLIITENYMIPGFWKNRTHEFQAYRISEELGKPSVSKRSMPLALSFPVRVSQIIVAHLPESFEIEKSGSTIESDAVRYKYQYDTNGTTLTLTYQLQTKRDYVAVENIAAHLALIDRIRGTLGYEISTARAEGNDTAGAVVFALIFFPVVILGVLLAIKSTGYRLRTPNFTRAARTQILGPLNAFSSRYLRRRYSTKSVRQGMREMFKSVKSRGTQFSESNFVRRIRPGDGDAPQTAIQIINGGDLYQILTELRCSCGLSYMANNPAPQSESAMFDGKRLTIVRLNCESCRKVRDVYFVNPTSVVPD